MINEQKIKEELKEYLDKYGSYYSKEQLEFISEEFINYAGNDQAPDIILQINSYLGLDSLGDIYHIFLNHLENDCDINCDILEVACGIYPAFGVLLSNQQRSGTITVMDPEVITMEYSNIKAVKESFTEDTDLSNYNLICSIMPCRVTNDMIKSANRQDKDLYLELCGCIDSKISTYNYNYMIMLKNYEKLLKQTLPYNRSYEIKYVDDLPYNIIRTYKTKKMIDFHKAL